MLVITKVSKHVQRENAQGHDMRWSIMFCPFFSSALCSVQCIFWDKRKRFHGTRNSFCSAYAWHIKKRKFLIKLSMSCFGEVIWGLLGKVLKGPFKNLLPNSYNDVDAVIHGYLNIWCWRMKIKVIAFPKALKGNSRGFFRHVLIPMFSSGTDSSVATRMVHSAQKYTNNHG